MPFKSKLQQRFMHHLQEKGKLPKSVNLGEWDHATDFSGLPEHKFEGGEIGDDDEMEEFHDEEWNNHHDTDGEPEDHFSKPKYGFAFGGKVMAKEDMEHSFKGSLHGHEMDHANFHGPAEEDEPNQALSDSEVRRHMAKALMRRKQIGSRGV